MKRRGRVDTSRFGTGKNNIYKLLEIHAWYRAINMGGDKISAISSSNLVNEIIRALDGGTASNPVTTLFLGHDADIDHVRILGRFEFHMSPYPKNGVPPLTALIFDRLNNGELQVSTVGVVVSNETNPLSESNIIVTPVDFSNNSKSGAEAGTVTYSKFREAILGRLDGTCIENPVPYVSVQVVMILGILAIAVGCLLVFMIVIKIAKTCRERYSKSTLDSRENLLG